MRFEFKVEGDMYGTEGKEISYVFYQNMVSKTIERDIAYEINQFMRAVGFDELIQLED